MKINAIKTVFAFLLCNLVLLTSCEDWTEIDTKYKEDLINPAKPAEYYEQLRAYKKTDHAITFGWIGGMTGLGASMANCFSGLPDSTDVVSLWSGLRTEAFLEDMRYCQQVKGIRFLKCMFSKSCPDKYGWTYMNPKEGDPVMEKAITDWVRDLIAEIEEMGYDGLDIDHEPTVGGAEAKGNLGSSKVAMTFFIKELGKYIGPMSGSDKLLTINGEVNNANICEVGKYFSYLVSQSYGTSRPSVLQDSKFKWVLKNFTENATKENRLTPEEVAHKFITCENFEDYALTGGVEYTDENGNTMPSLIGMASWNPIVNGKVVRKGGCGAFHMEYEYAVPGYTEFYPFHRRAIQVMNPSVH